MPTAYQIEVKGLGSWSYGGRIYKPGRHTVDALTAQAARMNRNKGHDHGVYIVRRLDASEADLTQSGESAYSHDSIGKFDEPEEVVSEVRSHVDELNRRAAKQPASE